MNIYLHYGLRKARIPKFIILKILIMSRHCRALRMFIRSGYLVGIKMFYDMGYEAPNHYFNSAIIHGRLNVLEYSIENKIINNCFILFALEHLRFEEALMIFDKRAILETIYIYYNIHIRTKTYKDRLYPVASCDSLTEFILSYMLRLALIRGKIRAAHSIMKYTEAKRIRLDSVRLFAILTKNWDIDRTYDYYNITNQTVFDILQYGYEDSIRYLINLVGPERALCAHVNRPLVKRILSEYTN